MTPHNHMNHFTYYQPHRWYNLMDLWLWRTNFRVIR